MITGSSRAAPGFPGVGVEPHRGSLGATAAPRPSPGSPPPGCDQGRCCEGHEGGPGSHGSLTTSPASSLPGWCRMKTLVTWLGSITASKVLTVERELPVQAWEAAPESTCPPGPCCVAWGTSPNLLKGGLRTEWRQWLRRWPWTRPVQMVSRQQLPCGPHLCGGGVEGPGGPEGGMGPRILVCRTGRACTSGWRGRICSPVVRVAAGQGGQGRGSGRRRPALKITQGRGTSERA